MSYVFNPFTGNFDDVSDLTVTVGATPNSNASVVTQTGTAIALTLEPANTTYPGILLAADWNTFNNKQSALTFGNLTDAGTDGITVTGGTGAVIGSGTSLSQHVADTTHNGYLSSTDWNTFNGKAANGFIYLTTGSAYGGTNSTLTFTGVDNTVVGQSAGNVLAAGARNTLYGYQAGLAITAGSDAVLIGSQAGSTNSASLNKTVIVGSSSADSGSTDGSVGIGYGVTTNGGSIVIGQASTASTGNGGVSLGKSAAHSGGSVAIGNTASALGGDLALGYHTSVAASGSSAFGQYLSIASHTYSAAFGNNTNNAALYDPTSANNQITFGVPGYPMKDLYLGNGAVATAIPTASSIRPTPASGLNVAGVNLSLIAGNGTGSGGSGSIIFQTAPVAASSSTPDTLTTCLTLAPSGAATFVSSVSAASLSLTTALAVSSGGTGLATLTANNVILGNGTSSPTFVAPGTSGNVLTSNGTTWVSSSAPSGPNAFTFVAETSNYTAVAGNYISCNATGGAFTVTLPTAVGVSGQTIVIQKVDINFNSITVNTTSSQTIDNSLTTTVDTQNEAITVVSNGANWLIQDRKIPSNVTSWTPTFTGFGTVTSINGEYSRSGPYMDYYLSFTPGTEVATTCSATLPSGLTSAAYSAGHMAGSGQLGAASQGQFGTYISPSATVLYFSRQDVSTAGNGSQTGTTFGGSGALLSFFGRIRIAGWN